MSQQNIENLVSQLKERIESSIPGAEIHIVRADSPEAKKLMENAQKVSELDASDTLDKVEDHFRSERFAKFEPMQQLQQLLQYTPNRNVSVVIGMDTRIATVRPQPLSEVMNMVLACEYATEAMLVRYTYSDMIVSDIPRTPDHKIRPNDLFVTFNDLGIAIKICHDRSDRYSDNILYMYGEDLPPHYVYDDCGFRVGDKPTVNLTLVELRKYYNKDYALSRKNLEFICPVYGPLTVLVNAILLRISLTEKDEFIQLVRADISSAANSDNPLKAFVDLTTKYNVMLHKKVISENIEFSS